MGGSEAGGKKTKRRSGSNLQALCGNASGLCSGTSPHHQRWITMHSIMLLRTYEWLRLIFYRTLRCLCQSYHLTINRRVYNISHSSVLAQSATHSDPFIFPLSDALSRKHNAIFAHLRSVIEELRVASHHRARAFDASQIQMLQASI